jgi:hypothetical protein
VENKALESKNWEEKKTFLYCAALLCKFQKRKSSGTALHSVLQTKRKSDVCAWRRDADRMTANVSLQLPFDACRVHMVQ